MATDLNPPVFLERRSYRQRRMMDAVRLLPLIGFILWMLPTLWLVPDEAVVEPVKMSRAIIYVFGVWVSLILSGGVIWRFLVSGADKTDATATDPDDGPR